MRPDAYFVTYDDCGADMCDDCAGSALSDYASETFGNLDGHSALYDINAARSRWIALKSDRPEDIATADAAVRRLRAAVRFTLMGRSDNYTLQVWDVEATLEESEKNHAYGSDIGQRCKDALSLIHQNFRGYAHWEDISPDSHGGVYCEGCSKELQAPWVICRTCGHDDSATNFGFADGYGAEFDVESDSEYLGRYWDGLSVERCYHCVDDPDYGDAASHIVLLEDDGRGYTLRYWEASQTYTAGCRKFTAAQAIAHWRNPSHYAPESAARLADAVAAHEAMLADIRDRAMPLPYGCATSRVSIAYPHETVEGNAWTIHTVYVGLMIEAGVWGNYANGAVRDTRYGSWQWVDVRDGSRHRYYSHGEVRAAIASDAPSDEYVAELLRDAHVPRDGRGIVA